MACTPIRQLLLSLTQRSGAKLQTNDSEATNCESGLGVRVYPRSKIEKCFAMKTNRALVLTILLLTMSASGLLAQVAMDNYAAPPGVPLRGPSELDQLVGPIALYPDPLIAELLPAATQPAQVNLADRILSDGADISQLDLQPLDGSVKALARYPTVLRWMDENLAWTTELGQAFLYQQAEVMNSIQRLRAQALALGNLQSNPQQTVLTANGIIEIVPANPQVVYVPIYQPQVVYVQPPPQPGAYISFGVGWPVGIWLNHDFDWEHRHVIVWHRDHPRPPDWWRRPPERRYGYYAREPVTVWRPRAHPAFSDRDRESRGWSAAPSRIERPVARVESPPPRERDRVEARPPGRSEVERRPAEVRPLPRPAAPPARSWEIPAQQHRPEPGRAPAPVGRASTGALIGVQSTPDTRQYSARGQQSRQEPGRSAVGAPQGRPPAPAATRPSNPEPEAGRSHR